jgi:hypothetical protein
MTTSREASKRLVVDPRHPHYRLTEANAATGEARFFSDSSLPEPRKDGSACHSFTTWPELAC